MKVLELTERQRAETTVVLADLGIGPEFHDVIMQDVTWNPAHTKITFQTLDRHPELVALLQARPDIAEVQISGYADDPQRRTISVTKVQP